MLNIRSLFGRAAVLFALITLIPSFAFAQVATSAATTTDSTSSGQATTTTSQVPIDPHNQADVSLAIAQYFADIPVMYEIAKCESNFTQYGSGGSVLNGGSGGMLGVFQINGSVHKTFAKSLGDDITTLVGNMAYARYLYDESGTDPWISSEPCWGSADAAEAVAALLGTATNNIVSAITPDTASASTSASTPAVAPTTAPIINDTPKQITAALTSNLKVGSTGAQVLLLQQMLNQAGFKIAKSGPGSPGQETSSFGPATKAAVERFQCAQNIVCKGTENSTGYGYAGTKTRVALVKAAGALVLK